MIKHKTLCITLSCMVILCLFQYHHPKHTWSKNALQTQRVENYGYILPLTTESSEAKKLYFEAMNEWAHYRLDSADQKIAKAINEDTTFAMAYLVRAFCRTVDRNEYLSKALSFSNNVSLAEKSFIQGDYAFFLENDAEKAVEWYQKAVENYPESKWAAWSLGVAFIWKDGRKSDKALKYFEKAISHDDKLARGYASMGMVFLAQEKYEQALRALQQAIDLVPHVSYIHKAKGDALTRLGRIDEAEQSYRKAEALGK